jgi:hypothetical protein
VELLSYGIGPSAGQLRSGVTASLTSVRFSLVSGGLCCVGAAAGLRLFRERYVKDSLYRHEHAAIIRPWVNDLILRLLSCIDYR